MLALPKVSLVPKTDYIKIGSIFPFMMNSVSRRAPPRPRLVPVFKSNVHPSLNVLDWLRAHSYYLLYCRQLIAVFDLSAFFLFLLVFLSPSTRWDDNSPPLHLNTDILPVIISRLPWTRPLTASEGKLRYFQDLFFTLTYPYSSNTPTSPIKYTQRSERETERRCHVWT